MRAVSDAFLRALTGSHRMVTRATVCSVFQTGTTPTGVEIPIHDGDVQLDSAADNWGTLDLTTTWPWPTTASAELAPYGNEIYIERGIQLRDDLNEWVGLGYYRIDDVDQATAPDGAVRVSGSDRMSGIREARLTSPQQFAVGATYGYVVTTLVQQVYPTAIIEWDDTTYLDVLTRSMICEEDRHQFLNDLVTAKGKIWYWDHRGVLVITSIPSTTTPVWEMTAGEYGTLVRMSRRLTRRGVYNAVVASGEGADTETPPRAVVVDADPNSPTSYAGRFGPVPRFFSSPFISTNMQADAAARSLLVRQLGLPYTVDLEATPNPALVPYDPILVRYSNRHGAETHVLETISIPLTAAGTMSARTREQTVVLLGGL